MNKENNLIGDFIKAFQIFEKYLKPDEYFSGCEHDALHVYIDPSKVSKEDKKTLDKLGFFADEGGEGFTSFRYGSA